jgi:hypothetical protein
MPESNKSKYVELWERYLPVIIQTLQNCNSNMRHILLNSYEFKLAGNMKNYSFNLEYTDGKVSNNIKGSALARDLATVMEESKSARQIIATGHIKIRMDKKFCLWICKMDQSTEMVLDFGRQLFSNL